MVDPQILRRTIPFLTKSGLTLLKLLCQSEEAVPASRLQSHLNGLDVVGVHSWITKKIEKVIEAHKKSDEAIATSSETLQREKRNDGEWYYWLPDELRPIVQEVLNVSTKAAATPPAAIARRLSFFVSDFGPIARAHIELRPLTVFVGPSNSGKSYLASLIYALHKSLSGFHGQPENWSFLPQQFWAGRIQEFRSRSHELTEEDAANILFWLREGEGRELLSNEEKAGFMEIPEPISKLVKPIIEDDFLTSASFERELSRCFGLDQTWDLCRHESNSEAHLHLQVEAHSEGKENVPFSYTIDLTKQGTRGRIFLPEGILLNADVENFGENFHFHWFREETWPKDVPEIIFASVQILMALASSVSTGLVDPISRPAYFLPAGRAGVMHSHQVVVRSLIAGASRAALRPESNIPILSGVLGDFLDQLVSLASRSPDTDEDHSVLAHGLEHSMLRGTVSVDKSIEIEYPSFSFRPEGWNKSLPLMNVSSMVSELAPVVLYLRHLVRPGDLLIIEEPEAHLHPKLQAVFIRQLVAAVQSGIRILITTHSEWILEELANLLRLSEIPVDRRRDIDDPDIAISPDQLGTWFFDLDEKRGGSVVREIPLDEESATFPAGYGLVADSLYNRWAEITSQIQEQQ